MQLAEHLSQNQIPTTSAVRAIAEINAQGDLGVEEYKARISLLTNKSTTISDKYLRHVYMYLVDGGLNGQMDLDHAEKRATTFVDANGWCLVKDESSSATPKGLDAAGNPKQKKGAKKDRAIRFYNDNKTLADKDNWTRKLWIEKLMEEIGLTAGGASTYLANLKNGTYK